MQVLALLLSTVCAIDCAMHDLQSFDKVHTVSRLADTEPHVTNVTVYFNPCTPLKDIPMCGDDNHYCEIHSMEINGINRIVAVKQAGSPKNGMHEQLSYRSNGKMDLGYFGGMWGDDYIHRQVLFECERSLGDGSDPEFELHEESTGIYSRDLIVKTPLVCGIETPNDYDSFPPWGGGPKVSSVWEVLGRIEVYSFIALTIYVSAALFVSAQTRTLGSFVDEVGHAIYKLPRLISLLLLSVYKRIFTKGPQYTSV